MTSSMSGSFLFRRGNVLFYSRPKMVYVVLCSNSHATKIGAYDQWAMDKIFRKSGEDAVRSDAGARPTVSDQMHGVLDEILGRVKTMFFMRGNRKTCNDQSVTCLS